MVTISSIKHEIIKLTEVIMLNRIRQFTQNISYAFHKIDEDFLLQYLNHKEYQLFGRLGKSEQVHSILVAKDISGEHAEKADRNFIKAVLFHDIGKIIRPMNIMEKSIAVVLSRLMGDGIRRLDRIDFISAYLNHGERGYEILKSELIFEETPIYYDLIRLHHMKRENLSGHIRTSISNEDEFFFYYDLLKKYDDRY